LLKGQLYKGRMKILFINKEDNRGGTAQVAWNLAVELRKNGHEVRYIVRRKFSTDKNVYELKENPILCVLRKITKRDFTIVLSNLRDQILANDIDTGVEKEIINHPWIEWADVIHCHNLHGNYFKLSNLVNLSKRKPVVWTLHDLWAINSHSAIQKKSGESSKLSDYQKILWDNTKYLINSKKKIYSQVNASLVVPSNWMAEMVGKSILRDKKIDVVVNGIDTTIYRKLNNKNKLKDELDLPKDKKIILFFTYGSKNPSKGWNHIRKIIDYYKDNKDVFFVGIGSNKSRMDPENVIYINPIYNPGLLVKYYNCADLLLFASLAESFGMVPLEAVSCGDSVVSFPVGVIPELITHKVSGYIAKYDDTKDLINGVNFFLNKTEKDLREVSYKNIDKVKKSFTLRKMAEGYSKIYARIRK
jgi:glycosyltransferase involved in cell wall biosynthesis